MTAEAFAFSSLAGSGGAACAGIFEIDAVLVEGLGGKVWIAGCAVMVVLVVLAVGGRGGSDGAGCSGLEGVWRCILGEDPAPTGGGGGGITPLNAGNCG